MKKAGRVHFLEPAIFNTTGVTIQGFTTRHEGVSRQPFNSLNLGSNTFDSPHSVNGNRSILARAFGAKLEKMVTVNQVHGVDLLIIDSPNRDYVHFTKLECDGIVTSQPGVMIGICVADCVPILLLDPVKRVIAALHAGWKGTAGNIAGKGVDAMAEIFGSTPADILAAIGPSIRSCCYEVDSPVMESFGKNLPVLGSLSQPASPGKWRLNLGGINQHQLQEAGVEKANIATTHLCVSCEHDLFFSHRRDKGETGRQMGFIMLK